MPDKRTILLACAVATMMAAGPAAQDWVVDPPERSEFPEDDTLIRSYQLVGLRTETAEHAFRTAPDRAATFDLLLKSGRIADALAVLERIVADRPAEIRDAFAAIGIKGREIASDPVHDYAARLRAAVAAARRRLPELPREEAARIARQLVDVEGELSLEFGSDRRQRLATFVREYAGTREAALARVLLLMDESGRTNLEALDAFVREHPGTEAAAMALHTKGFHLAQNAFSLGERAGDDPTDRFFRVLDIYNELRSGKYPPSEWVDTAPSLVTGFSAYKASYAPGNAERILAAYEALLPVLLEAFERGDTRNSIPFFVGWRMGELFALKGDPVPAIDGVFDRLAKLAKNSHAVNLLRVQLYLRPPERVIDAQRWPSLRLNARSVLESLVRNASGFERRKGLATLATLHFRDGDLERAKALYEQYVETWPDSPYAWVAALRIGECEVASAPERAAEAYRRAAARYSTNPMARVLGHAYAARAWEALGDYSKALGDYQAALAAWDARYGRYSLSRPQRPPDGSLPLVDRGEVTREHLQERIAALVETMAVAGGDVVERARLSIAGGRWDQAIAAASEFLSAHPESPLASDARYLLHRARLEQALEIADGASDSAALGEAIVRLEALTREPLDSAVAAAKLALGTARHLAGVTGDTSTLVAAALGDWQTLDRSRAPIARHGDFEADVIAIRDAVFHPDGSGLLQTHKWDAYRWSASLPFVLTSPALRVRTSAGSSLVVAYDPFPHVPNAVFLDDERRTLLERIMMRLGGTKKRPWVHVMQTPNQPDGPALDVLALWRQTFWAQPGHWGGWIFEAFPIVNEIEFSDERRTKAAVKIRVGYTGATVALEKRDGRWTATGLSNFWIE